MNNSILYKIGQNSVNLSLQFLICPFLICENLLYYSANNNFQFLLAGSSILGGREFSLSQTISENAFRDQLPQKYGLIFDVVTV